MASFNEVLPIRTSGKVIKSMDRIDSLVSLHPAGRLGKPIEVAKTVLFLEVMMLHLSQV